MMLGAHFSPGCVQCTYLDYYLGQQPLELRPETTSAGKKETKLGLSAKKATEFGDWYSQVVVESEMISYYAVSGPPPLPHKN